MFGVSLSHPHYVVGEAQGRTMMLFGNVLVETCCQEGSLEQYAGKHRVSDMLKSTCKCRRRSAKMWYNRKTGRANYCMTMKL